MPDLIRTGAPICETLLAEIQLRAESQMWGTVDPVATWEVIDRKSGKVATIQRRGAFYFAASGDRTSGPASTVAAAFTVATS